MSLIPLAPLKRARFPRSLAANPRDFVFYVADPVSSIYGWHGFEVFLRSAVTVFAALRRGRETAAIAGLFVFINACRAATSRADQCGAVKCLSGLHRGISSLQTDQRQLTRFEIFHGFSQFV
jgi:hypothetical protein